MHRYIFILIIPLFFTFTLDQLVKFSKSTKEEYLTSIKVNSKYSEKIIQDQEFKNIKFDKNIINFDITNKKLDTNQSNWKKNFSEKKIVFLETLLPLVAFENKKILLERNRLLNIKNFLNSNKTLYDHDIKHLYKVSKKYKINIKDRHKIDIVDKLLLRVNIIPNSIVLAQAINESGWGNSRFAKEHNALFGQYTYDENDGVKPYNRMPGKKHLIKNFSSIDKSVESYFININTHNAYEDFRLVRNLLSPTDLHKDIKLLTQNLNSYAEDKTYVQTINSIIDTNNLQQFDLTGETFIGSYL